MNSTLRQFASVLLGLLLVSSVYGNLTPDSVLNTYSLYGVDYIKKTSGASANTSPGGAIGSAGEISVISSPITINHDLTTPARFSGGNNGDTVTGRAIVGTLHFGGGGTDVYKGNVFVKDTLNWNLNDGGTPRIGGPIQIGNTGLIQLNLYNHPYFNGVQYTQAQTLITAASPPAEQANVTWVNPSSLPQAPIFATGDFPDTLVNSGTVDITVPNYTSRTLVPSEYGNLDVGFGATLYLTSGIYSFKNVHLAGDNSQIIVDVSSGKRAVIVVNGTFTNGSASTDKPCMIQTRADTGKGMEDFYGFLMMVMHQNTPLNFQGGSPGSLRIAATVSVPNTKVILNSGIALYGQIFAQAIEMTDFQGGTLGQFHKFDPIIPTIKLATASGNSLVVAENDPDSRVITIPVQLSQVNGMNVSVDYQIISRTGGTNYAIYGQDYDTTSAGVKGSGTLDFLANTLTPVAPLQFYLINDDLVEDAETLYVALFNPDKCKLSAPDTLTDTLMIVITSEDVPRAPTDIAISNASILENQPALTYIGKFSAIDPDNTPPFVYTLVVGAGDVGNGNFVISNDSLFSAIAFDFEASAAHSIRVRVTDNDSRYFEKAFSIQVLNVNDLPTITSITDTTILEDGTTGPRTFTIADAETPVTSLSVTVTSSNLSLVPLSGISLSGTGASRTITVNPLTEAFGTSSITVTVSDGNGAQASSIWLLTVNPVNDKPVAADDTQLADEDVAKSILATALLANDNDTKDGSTLTVSKVFTPVNGTVSMTGGTITFTPALDFNGTASFQYEITDAGNPLPGLKDTGLVTITVNPVNDKPVATDDTQSTDEDVAKSILATALLANDNDTKDGSTLTVSKVFTPVNGTVSMTGGTITFTPALDFNGTASFQYEITDAGNPLPGLMDTGLVTITVNPVNDKPVAADDTQLADEDVAKSILATALLANDNDTKDGSTLTVSKVFTPVNGTVSMTGGTITFTPALDFNGTASFQYEITDAGNPLPGLMDTGLVTITVNPVNDKPVATDDTQLADEDVAKSILATALLANDNDTKDGSILTVSKVFTAVNGTVSMTGGTITFTPALDYNGTASFQYEITDAGNPLPGLKDTGLVTITVNPVNDKPVAADDTQLADEDVAKSILATALLANDNDTKDGSTLTVSKVFTAVNGTVSMTGGTITFTPTLDFNGTASFQYEITDAGNPLPGLMDTGLVTITVNPVNDKPVAADDTQLADEDVAKSILATALLANDNDTKDGSTLTVSKVFTAVNGTVSMTGGTITFTPALDFNGTASFQYEITDAGNPLPGLKDTGLVTITVNPVNDKPVATDDTQSTDEDVAKSILATALLANDNDTKDGSTLTVSKVFTAVNGTVSMTGGTITFTPALDYNGTASFQYEITDAGNPLPGLKDTGLVTITVNPVNDKPVATDDTQLADEDVAKSILATALLANDNDTKDGSTLTVSKVFTPVNGTVSMTGGTITFTPALDFNGTASFQYEITDAGNPLPGLKDTGLVTITVNPVNDKPVATDDTQSTDEDVAKSILATALLANDNDTKDGSTLTVSKVFTAVNGTVYMTGGTITFTPALDYNGTASFQYEITDAGNPQPGLKDTGLVTITVNPVNDAPSFLVTDLLVDRAESSPEVSILNFATLLSAGPADESMQSLTFSVLNNNPALFSAQPTLDATGTLTFTPVPFTSDSAKITVRLFDNGGVARNGVDSSSAVTFTIVITAVNDAPTFIAGSNIIVAEDDPPQMIPWASGISAGQNEADQSVQFLVSNDQAMLFSVQPSIDIAGVLRFTPALNANGIANIRVQLRDNGGVLAQGVDTTATISFTITITPVNDHPILAGIPSQSAAEDIAWSYTAVATDVDVPETLVYSLSQFPEGLTINSQSGKMIWIAKNAQVGTHGVTVIVTDLGGLQDSVNFSITVSNTNDTPRLLATPDTSILEDVASQIQVRYEEDDLGDIAEFKLVQAPVGVRIHLTSGAISWTPGNGDVGKHTVIVRIADRAGAFDLDTFVVTVLNVNDAPVLGNASLSVKENTRAGFTIGKIPATDIDVGAKLTFSKIGGSDKVSIGSDGTVKVAQLMDYESAIAETLLVAVSDGLASDTDRYIIQVLDEKEITLVEIIRVMEDDSTWNKPDSVWTKDSLVDVTWSWDDVSVADRMKVKEGVNVIVKEYLAPGKDTWGRDTVVVIVNRKNPEVTLVLPPERKPPTPGTVIEEPVDEKGVFYINDAEKEIFGRVIVIGKDLKPDTLMIQIHPDLVEGENEVIYSWTDVFGNTSTDTVRVILDTQAPIVRILRPADQTKTTQFVVPVEWTVDGRIMDTLNLQSLAVGENRIIRTYRDRAGNEGADTVYLTLKDAKKAVKIELEDPLVLLDQKKIDQYYKVNPPEEGEYFALSIVNAKSGKEEEVLIGSGSSVKKGEGREPYPGMGGSHLGPTLQVEVKLPAMGGLDAAGNPRGGDFASIMEEDGKISLDEGAGEDRVRISPAEYREKHCLENAFEGLSLEQLKNPSLYRAKLTLEIMVYDGIGQFVDRIVVQHTIDNADYLSDANRVSLYLELKPHKDAGLRNQRGRAYGTGAYVMRGLIKSVSTLLCDLPSATMGTSQKNDSELLQTFGFRRDQ